MASLRMGAQTGQDLHCSLVIVKHLKILLATRKVIKAPWRAGHTRKGRFYEIVNVKFLCRNIVILYSIIKLPRGCHINIIMTLS